MTRTILVAGSGGVGKTTLSAALGVAAARAGGQVLVLTVDPAKRLADALGMVQLGNLPTATTQKGLSAAMLDSSAAWDALVDRHAPPDVAERLHESPYFRAIADRFPAGQSYAACEQMADHIDERTWDVVIVDTPPAGGGIDFFQAPGRVRRLVGGRLLRWLTGASLPGRRRLYSFTARPALRLADAIVGGPLLEEVAEFLLDLRSLYDGVSRRARQIDRQLKRAKTVVVTTAHPSPLVEAARFFTELPETAGLPTSVVFNRALPAEWASPTVAGSGVLADNLKRWGAESQRQLDARSAFAAQHGIEPAVVPWMADAPTSISELGELVESAQGLDLTALGISS
ncbi:MAG: AAA family ATPase [Acidimicrobiia bacterium]|nr:AAA family ATPase [Acidimicrobiia bacterium]MDH3471967.1 AAA family ATPase [Acidimicrobiia bacterium]